MGLTTATARMLLAPGEATGALTEQVARRLGRAIRLGLLIDGDRLPTESQLAAQMGVSTVTLRDALTTLREQGLVVTRRGRGGGTFVKAPVDSQEPLRHFGVHELQELGDQRAAIRGAAARLAAERALPEEVERLGQQVERLGMATTASERRRADTQLTIGIAAAAQSSRLTREEARLRAEVGDLLGLELSEAEHEAIIEDRRRLVEAIRRRRADKARELAEAEVAAETARLVGLRLKMREGEPGTAREASDELLTEVREDLQRIFAALDPLAERFAHLRRDRGAAIGAEHLAELRPTIFSILESESDLVSGAGVVCAPGLLTDAERWLEWWWVNAPGSRPEPMRVNLDREAPDFYDYTTADWFATSLATRGSLLSGPFVDYACTNTYAMTLSVPVEVDGEFCGVAAADVLVASLEARILPHLARLDRRVALTTAEGRLIASNDAALVSGQRLLIDGAPRNQDSPRSIDGLQLIEL